MNYHIDTIPLWDALKLDSECPLCIIQRHLELQETEKFLGASVMDPDTRVRVNDKGFCKAHQKMLITGNNRLGLALLMESHINKVKPALLGAVKTAKEEAASKKPLRFGKNSQIKESLETEKEKLQAISRSCILCETLSAHMKRYIEGFVILWKNDSQFRDAFAKSKGLCVEHIADCLEPANKHLSGQQAEEFLRIIEELTEQNLARQEEELKTFIKKFDYRNGDMPWGNSKDSVERMINRLQGWCVGQEPHPDDRNKDRKF